MPCKVRVDGAHAADNDLGFGDLQVLADDLVVAGECLLSSP